MPQPKLDPEIPPLINTVKLATLAGTSRSQVSMLWLSGLIPGAAVEGGEVAFQPKVAKALAKNPSPAKPVRDTEIPDLLTTSAIAAKWGVTRQNVDALYRKGSIPGRKVGGTPLFRAKIVSQRRQLPADVAKLLDDDGNDKLIPDLVIPQEAADILGLALQTVKLRYNAGQLPGAPYVAEGKFQSGVVFRRSVVEAAIGNEFHAQPTRDEKIPDLVNSGVAGTMLGTNRDGVRHLYLTGVLPGRPIEGEGAARIAYRKDVVQALADERAAAKK
jgi:hypothetical protein